MLIVISLYKFIPHYAELKINNCRRDRTQPERYDFPGIFAKWHQLPDRDNPRRDRSRRRASSRGGLGYGIPVQNQRT